MKQARKRGMTDVSYLNRLLVPGSAQNGGRNE